MQIGSLFCFLTAHHLPMHIPNSLLFSLILCCSSGIILSVLFSLHITVVTLIHGVMCLFVVNDSIISSQEYNTISLSILMQIDICATFHFGIFPVLSCIYLYLTPSGGLSSPRVPGPLSSGDSSETRSYLSVNPSTYLNGWPTVGNQ